MEDTKIENLIEDIYPLSPMQQGILFQCVLSPESTMYVSQMSCVLFADFDPGAFEHAWQQIIDRHSIFRTGFFWEGLDDPIQVVSRQVKVKLTQQDWRAFSRSDQTERRDAFISADRLRNFDLSEVPLLRLSLCRVSAEEYWFVWTCHHLLLDGWSETLLFAELAAFYEALHRGESLQLPAACSYGNYISWLQQQEMLEAEKFWRQLLKGFHWATPSMLETPADGGSVRQEAASLECKLSVADTAALSASARAAGLTLSTLVHGAWALLLSLNSGVQDVVFGTAVSGRPVSLAGVETAVGLFINTLPVRARVTPDAPLISWLRELQDQQAEARQYEYSPLVQVQGWSDLPRGARLFETLLVFQNTPLKGEAPEQPERSGRLRAREIRSHDGWTEYLSVDVRPGPALTIIMSFDSLRYATDRCRQLLVDLETLLVAFAASPEKNLGELQEIIGGARKSRRVEKGRELAAASLQKLKHSKRKIVRGVSLSEGVL